MMNLAFKPGSPDGEEAAARVQLGALLEAEPRDGNAVLVWLETGEHKGWAVDSACWLAPVPDTANADATGWVVKQMRAAKVQVYYTPENDPTSGL